MLGNKVLLYKGTSIQEYYEIIGILELNNIKYTDKVKNKNNDFGPIINKIMFGTLGEKEDFTYERSVFVAKDDYEYAKSLLNSR